MHQQVKKTVFAINLLVLGVLSILILFFIKGFYDVTRFQTSDFNYSASEVHENPFNEVVEGTYPRVIITKYRNAFEDVEIKYETLLEELIQQGKMEYIENKDNRSIYSLGNKYLSALHQIEDQSNKEVTALLLQMTEELESQNHDTSIVTAIEAYYQWYKQQQKQALYNRFISGIDG